MVDKIKGLVLVSVAGIIFGTGLFILCNTFDYDNIYDNINVWYKVSTDELNPGEVLALEMSRGYATSDNHMIYIIVTSIESSEEIVVAFPNGGYWESPGIDTVSVEIQKHFGKLEQDLKGK